MRHSYRFYINESAPVLYAHKNRVFEGHYAFKSEPKQLGFLFGGTCQIWDNYFYWFELPEVQI